MANCSPRLHNRFTQHFIWIVNGPNPSGAGGVSAVPSCRACRIDFTDFEWNDDRLVSAYYSCDIARIATYAMLCRNGKKETSGNRERHQKICYNTRENYLKKLDQIIPGVYNSWHREFKVTQRSFLSRKSNHLRRIFSKRFG